MGFFSLEKDTLGNRLPNGTKLFSINTEIYKDLLQNKINKTIECEKNQDYKIGNLIFVHNELDLTLCKHFTSEHKAVYVNKKTFKETEIWQKRTSHSRNDYWDCMVYALCLADYRGYRDNTEPPVQKPKYADEKNDLERQRARDILNELAGGY